MPAWHVSKTCLQPLTSVISPFLQPHTAAPGMAQVESGVTTPSSVHMHPGSPGGHDDDDSSLSDSSEEHEHNSQQPQHDPNDPNQPASQSATASTDDPSSSSFVPSGANKTKGGYRKVIRKDKQKHNESESRRRSRLRGQFMELRTAAKCSKKDRFSILNHALERFAYLEERVQQLEKSRGIRSLLSGMGAGGGDGGDADSGKEDGDGADGSGTVVGGANSSFSAPSSNRNASNATTAAPTKDNSANGGSYTSSFHSYDANNNTAGPTVVNAPVKVLADPLTNYPILACLPSCFIALDGKFKDTNTAFCHLLGYNRDSLLQTTLFTVTHPNELMSTFAQLKRLLGGEVDCWEGPKLLVRGDGSVLSVHMTITCAKKYGKPEQYVGFFVPKSNSEPAGGQTAPSPPPLPQPPPHMQPPPMPPMYGGPPPPMRAPMPPQPPPLPRSNHSSFAPLSSYPPVYGDPSMSSPHGRPMGGGSFMPPAHRRRRTTREVGECESAKDVCQCLYPLLSMSCACKCCECTKPACVDAVAG